MPDFRPCSTSKSHSQAPLCHCTLCLISIQPEGTFGRLRYSLGGDRPSQTAHLTLFSSRIHGLEVEPRSAKSGISLSPPHPPQGMLHRVPPILRMTDPDPMPSYSKAPRGLFVLSR